MLVVITYMHLRVYFHVFMCFLLTFFDLAFICFGDLTLTGIGWNKALGTKRKTLSR